MVSLISGRLSVLVVTILIFVCFIVFLQRAKKKVPQVRRLAGIDAIEEGVGRAVEMGRPVHFTPGYGSAENAGGLASPKALALLSGISILGYTAKLCASMKAELIATFANPELIPLASDLVRNTYAAANSLVNFRPENVRFISTRQYAYASGLLGIFQREKIATNVMTGDLLGEALILAEGGNAVGAFQVGGSQDPQQLAYLVTVCDYCLIGEELYAASAYTSEDPIQRGALRGTDVFRLGLIVVTVIGMVLALMGEKTLSAILSM